MKVLEIVDIRTNLIEIRFDNPKEVWVLETMDTDSKIYKFTYTNNVLKLKTSIRQTIHMTKESAEYLGIPKSLYKVDSYGDAIICESQR